MIGNHLFYIDIILLTVYSILFSALSYAIGVFVFNFKSENEYRKALYNLIFGALLILDLYSCIYTGFKTVNVCSLLLLIYLSFDNKQFFNYRNLKFKYLLPLLYIFPLVFLLYGLYVLPTSIENDVKYYSKIVYALSSTGNENFYHFYNSYNAGFNGITPYHYIEFWLASIFHTSTGSMAIFSLKYFSYPFLISLILFGFLCNIKSYKWGFLIIILIVSLFPLHNYLTFMNVGWEFFTDFWIRPNFIPYYLSFALIFNALKDSNYKLFYTSVALSMTFSIVIMPVLFASCLLFAFYLFILKKQSLKQSLIDVFPAIVICFCLLLMYKIFGSKVNVTTSDINIKSILSHDLKIWKAIVFAIVALILEGSVILLLSYFLNKIKVHANKNNHFILFVFFLLFTSVLLFQLLNQLDNSYQFTYFAYSGIGFLFIILIIDLIEILHRPLFKISFILIMCLVFIVLSKNNFNISTFSTTLSEANLDRENVSKDWSVKYSAYIFLNPHAKGSFLFSSGLKDEFTPKERYCVNKQLGSYICYLTDDCNLPSITCRDSLLLGYTEENKLMYKTAIKWLDTFPAFTKNCSPETFLRNKTFDYFLCDLSYNVSDTTLKVLPDSLRHIKMVYLN